MSFNPQKHLTKVKGRDYLEVKWRLVWFREDHPDYTIDTDYLILDMDQGVAVCQATISDKNNRQLAQGTKTEYKSKFFDFVEKSETGAIGRALAALGYGTQFAPEMEEGERIVDSPIKNGKVKNNSDNSSQKQKKDNRENSMDKQELIEVITQEMENREFEIGEAKTILVNNFGKAGLRDCSVKNLKTYLEILRKERCEACKEEVSEKVVEFCENNQDRFEGKILCMECQKEY
ncbi:hypothetical protein [Sporohalobacter salinus]|uniref:hypothetical protein n=1 Tax=Sporohalobacter salinus TaxID=1494606 RepID=UPI001961111E|nr:hypothetical protein [Sporohalobacter salinus]MBM7623739.1 hypothetical protein [Sporohalobacter salinus]